MSGKQPGREQGQPTVPEGKIRCYIHDDKFRKAAPEEHVRQRVARSLVEEYGYLRADIHLSFRVNLGRARKEVDIAIFGHDQAHKQENVALIVETKREEVKPTNRDNGVGQLKSYLAACPNARWGMWFGSEMRAYEVMIEAGERRAVDVADIPPYGKIQPPRVTFGELVPAEGLRDPFRRCHNYIYANQGLPKDQSFREFLKLIFCKVHDEQNTPGELRFDVTGGERRSEVGQRRLRKRVDELFEEVKVRYRYIFEEHERIELHNRVLAYIIGELRRYSLLQTRTDVKGEAYQEIVGENLRGDRGEFFTPPNVCQMSVDMLFYMLPKNRRLGLKVLDPACGTGGFLRAVMNLWRSQIWDQEKDKWKDWARIHSETEKRLRELCDSNMFGIDINLVLVRASQMNLVMHGDGSSNVFQENSLLPMGEWSQDVRTQIGLESFDLVLTNPPFGDGPGLIVDDAHILDQFELSHFESASARSSMPPVQLFIERCYQFLKPGGLLAIVLPDSILSNPGLLFIRHWLLKYYRVVASIDLPVETFVAFGGTGTQTSVLVLQKKSAEDLRVEEASGRMQDYEAFMVLCETMGYDRRGKDLWLRTPQGDVIEQETVREVLMPTPEGSMEHCGERELVRVRDDDVLQVPRLFREWFDEQLELRRA